MTERNCLKALPVDDGRTGRSTFIVHDSINLYDDDDDDDDLSTFIAHDSINLEEEEEDFDVHFY